jgi:hypothetical protein
MHVPDASRRRVKVAGSIAAWDRAILQSTEFAANAAIAKPVKAIVLILMLGCFIRHSPGHWTFQLHESAISKVEWTGRSPCRAATRHAQVRTTTRHFAARYAWPAARCNSGIV